MEAIVGAPNKVRDWTRSDESLKNLLIFKNIEYKESTDPYIGTTYW